MSDDKKEELNNKAKKTASKSTLSLSLNIDMNKVLESKQKKLKGKTTIEVKSSKAKPKVEVKEDDVAIKENNSSAVSSNVKIQDVNKSSSNLTEDEKSLRLKILENISEEHKDQDISLRSFTVVEKNIDEVEGKIVTAAVRDSENEVDKVDSQDLNEVGLRENLESVTPAVDNEISNDVLSELEETAKSISPQVFMARSPSQVSSERRDKVLTIDVNKYSKDVTTRQSQNIDAKVGGNFASKQQSDNSTRTTESINSKDNITTSKEEGSPKIPMMTKVEVKKGYYDDSELESKKAKKKVVTEESKRKHLPNLKNVDIALVVESDEDEDLIENEVELESEVEVVKENSVAPIRENATVTYYNRPKRKNKKLNMSIEREKIIREVELSENISVKDLAAKMAEKVRTVLQALNSLGIKANEKKIIDIETAEIIATELGHKVNIVDRSQIEKEFLHKDIKEEDMVTRFPIVTIMGHVDHGKTTLLDTIRKTKVADKESGGITQHIGAYQIVTGEGKNITFLDTPGHEAFSQIRARGSKITDIVVLVVAADDGVKQQTVEAINHAKWAKVPIILAINKIDKPEKNPQKVKTELLQHNLIVEEMGGDVLCVEISAKQNIGIDKLLETILLQAEMLGLKTNNKVAGKGSIIEVKVQKGFGVIATVLVEQGLIKVGDNFVSGIATGKVKVMMNDVGKRLKEATSSMPIEISGFSGIVEAGDDFIIVPNEAKANELVNYRLEKQKQVKTVNKGINYFLSDNIENIKVLPLIIKADTQGSLEAIIGSFNKIQHKDLEIKVVHSGVGEINESDVMLSSAAKGVIIGFNARANNKARDIAKQEDVDIRYHSIIYNLIDDVKLILSGLLDPNIVEKIIGYAEVREVFNITKVGKIAGCYVREGTLKRSAYVRLLRDNVVIHSGVLSQLKRFKDDVREVNNNFECGVAIENYNDIKVGDLVECYEKNEVREKIE